MAKAKVYLDASCVSSSYFIAIEAVYGVSASYIDAPRWLFKSSQLLQVGRTANHAIPLELKTFSKIHESKTKQYLLCAISTFRHLDKWRSS